jgi:hypothetical protein
MPLHLSPKGADVDPSLISQLNSINRLLSIHNYPNIPTALLNGAPSALPLSPSSTFSYAPYHKAQADATADHHRATKETLQLVETLLKDLQDIKKDVQRKDKTVHLKQSQEVHRNNAVIERLKKEAEKREEQLTQVRSRLDQSESRWLEMKKRCTSMESEIVRLKRAAGFPISFGGRRSSLGFHLSSNYTYGAYEFETNQAADYLPGPIWSENHHPDQPLWSPSEHDAADEFNQGFEESHVAEDHWARQSVISKQSASPKDPKNATKSTQPVDPLPKKVVFSSPSTAQPSTPNGKIQTSEAIDGFEPVERGRQRVSCVEFTLSRTGPAYTYEISMFPISFSFPRAIPHPPQNSLQRHAHHLFGSRAPSSMTRITFQ